MYRRGREGRREEGKREGWEVKIMGFVEKDQKQSQKQNGRDALRTEGPHLSAGYQIKKK